MLVTFSNLFLEAYTSVKLSCRKSGSSVPSIQEILLFAFELEHYRFISRPTSRTNEKFFLYRIYFNKNLIKTRISRFISVYQIIS